MKTRKHITMKVGFMILVLLLTSSCDRGPGTGRGTQDSQDDIHLEIIDLASDNEWQCSLDDGPWRNIKVPGGGYNSDLQEAPLIDQEDVLAKVTYKRLIAIPEDAEGRVCILAFGAVNHGCEIYLNDTLVGTHESPLMPFEVDITKQVEPGQSYELKVVSHPQWYYAYNVPHAFIYAEARNHPDSRPDFASESGWATKFSYGITRYVELHIRPAVRIKDIFVQPSVSNESLTYDLWISNHSSENKDLVIHSEILAWKEAKWDYPDIMPAEVSVGAGELKRVRVGPVNWDLGPESYWWPNKPFREDYTAVLHNLSVQLKHKNRLVDQKTRRFGFVEWSEALHYYLVNGVRVNMISDGTPEPAMSEYDCYSVSPAFLPPTDSTQGCPETWKRYMRLGICANRIHQSTPTEYMMNVADELGFMLIAETPIRGCQSQIWTHLDPYLNAVKEMASYGRNHPSICRYSLLNEGTTEYIPELIDAILTVDATRPLVFEDNMINHPAMIEGKEGHAYAMMHYAEMPERVEIITGMGEYAWHWADRARYTAVPPGAEGGLEEFIYYGGEMRRRDMVYMAGWDFINYWPNFLEGMLHEKHAWKQSCYHKDREDGIDGWGSPVVALMQQYFHPFLVMDIGIHQMNGPDSDPAKWPEHTPACKEGERIERRLNLFNDGLEGNHFRLRWQSRWDSANGDVVDEGIIGNILVEPGFHKEIAYQMTAPEIENQQRRLFVLLTSELDGEKVFEENRIFFTITSK